MDEKTGCVEKDVEVCDDDNGAIPGLSFQPAGLHLFLRSQPVLLVLGSLVLLNLLEPVS